MTAVEQLAAFAARARYEDLSGEARDAVKLRVLDSLGCAIGALDGVPITQLRAHVDEFAGRPLAALIGGRSAPDRAAFYDAALVRYLVFNDSFLAAGETCHPSDSLGAVLAASEYTRRRGGAAQRARGGVPGPGPAVRGDGRGVGRRQTAVATKEQADHSLRYLAAVAWHDGEVMPAQYAADRIARAIQELLRHIAIRPAADLSQRFPEGIPCRVAVRLATGRVVRAERRDHAGVVTRPRGDLPRLTRAPRGMGATGEALAHDRGANAARVAVTRSVGLPRQRGGVSSARMVAPRTIVVVNPWSQGGRLGKRWRDIADTIGRAFPFEEAITEMPGDATRLTREALRGGVERVVAMGGDGTINEVVNGFFDDHGAAIAPDASLGVIPFGTGGDFRRTVHLPTELAEAARVIAAGHRRKIDVGRVEYAATGGGRAARMFANIASFGVSGVVDRLVNESGKRLGRLSFAIATARATWSYKNQRVQLVFDGADRVEATINTVAVANGRYFGGAMQVAPHAELDDGQFDVIAMGDFGFGDLLKSGRRLYQGTHLSMDKVTARRARVVEAEPIDPQGAIELDVDGENPGRLPARFTLVPSALWLVVPGGGGAGERTGRPASAS